MLFTTSNLDTQSIYILKVHLERVYQTKLLEIIVGVKLGSKFHVETLSKKLSRVIGAIKGGDFFT